MKGQTTDFHHSRRAVRESTGLGSWAKRAISCALARLSAGVRRRQTPGVPTTFNDRMLADIGLTRDTELVLPPIHPRRWRGNHHRSWFNANGVIR